MNIDFNTLELTPEDILKKHNPLEIFRRFSDPNLDLGKSISSPLRHNDDTPSFRLFISNGALLYKDFGGTCGNAIQFVQRMTGLNFYDTLRLIDNQLTEITYNKLESDKKLEQFIQTSKQAINYSVIYKPFCNTDKLYWSQYKITSNQLEKYHVKAAKFISKNGRLLQCMYSDDNPIYVYHVNNKYRFYKPKDKDKNFKWFGNLNNTCVYGLEQLKYDSDVLFITSSLKDVMCLDLLGYNAIAPPSETSFIPEVNLNELKTKYKHIYVYFNNDPPGKANSIKYTQKYHLNYVNNINGTPKDPSDIIKESGIEQLKEMITNKLKRDKVI